MGFKRQPLGEPVPRFPQPGDKSSSVIASITANKPVNVEVYKK